MCWNQGEEEDLFSFIGLMVESLVIMIYPEFSLMESCFLRHVISESINK
jgi:hypothetical protein